MADPRPDFKELLDRVNQGDERACRELYTHYNQELWNFARMYLKHHPPLRSVCRESDVLQETWQSAFDRLRKGKMPFETDAELLAWLLSIARHKAAKAVETYLGTDKRDLSRRESPEVAATIRPSLADPAPGPAEIVARNEIVEHFLQSLSDEDRLIFRMHREKYSFREIASQLGRHERTISRRVIHLLLDFGQQFPWPA